MSVPPLLGLRNVKVPVTNLAVALDWYGAVFGFRPTIEFPDSEGVLRGVHGELPGIGDVLALREDPAAARGLGAFAIANFEVVDRAALEAWVMHLAELGVAHGPIIDTPRTALLVICNPDGQEIHLYTPIAG
ncbi:MAG: VOC family protein [Mycobacteriales bacterium]